MITLAPITLEGYDVRLEPLHQSHTDGLIAAARDGRLWELWYTSVPTSELTADYIAKAIAGRDAGHMLPWAVRDLSTNQIVGTTRYHDILALAEEWPDVKKHLTNRLTRPR